MNHYHVWRRRIRRPLRNFVHVRYCPMQRPNKFDPLSLYGGLGSGLSTDAQALVHAVCALQSTQGRRRAIQTPPESPCNSSDSSFTRPPTPPPSSVTPCPFHGRGRAQPNISAARPAGTCSPSSTLCDASQEKLPLEKLVREELLQDKLLQNQQRPKKDFSECLRKEVMATTAVDVKELAGSYIFVADMPGLKHSDIKVQVENDNVLKISGERRREDADGEVKYVRIERSAGNILRKFNLPVTANLDAITANCQDGLLTIIVPKTPPPNIYRPRTFDVNVTSANLR